MNFPITDGKLRQTVIMFSKSVTWIYTRSLEHSWALKSETMSYVCAQEEEEGMSWLQTFPDRRWSGLVQKRMQISALQLPAERRGEYG